MDKFHRHLLVSYFDLAAELKETIVARRNLHKPGEGHTTCTDPLMTIIVTINQELHACKKRCLEAGIKESDLTNILSFFKLN